MGFRQFYEDHLEDECTVTALRMMVKDLLVLTQAVNEGVINVLGGSDTNNLVIVTTFTQETIRRTLL